MPSENRTNITIPDETKDELDLISDYLQTNFKTVRNRSAAIRYAASYTAKALGLIPKKKNRTPKKDT